MCMRLTGNLRRWIEMVEHARAAIADGDSSDSTAWALVGGLFNVRSVDAARQEMVAARLAPRSEEEALLAIQLLRTGEPSSRAVVAILDVADSYRDSEMVTAGAYMAVLEMSREAGLPADLATRFQPISETFFERWPDSKIMTRIDVSDLDNLIEYMREHFGRAADELQELVAKAVLGHLPYGLAAAVRGRTLSALLITRGLGCIPLGTVDAVQRECELQIAIAALDGQVVVDTNALHALGHTGLPAADLLSRFSRVIVTRQTLDDAMAGSDSLALKSTATMGWDPHADRPFLLEIDEAQADAWARDADELVIRARKCTVRDVVLPDSGSDDARLEVVLAPMEFARRERCALWSDDPALRQVAHSEGLMVFSTLALLEALVLNEAMSRADVRKVHLEMARSSLVDLPFDAELVLQLAEEEGWVGGAAAWPLSRPVNWADAAEQVVEVYRTCVVESHRVAPDALPNWSYAACLGAGRSILPHLRLNAVATLVLSGLLHAGSRPAILPLLLKGARAAAQQTGLEDPLPTLAQMLRSGLSEEVGEERTPQFFAHMVGGLDEPDRLLALAELLRPSPPS